MCRLTQGCRRLDGPVPLRAGEGHCMYCAGYGAQPIMFNPHYTQTQPLRCWQCGGSGYNPETRRARRPDLFTED